MSIRPAASFLSFLLLLTNLAAETPHLLLTAQRLKRLKRECARGEERWVNFEQRVKSVPDSPERGFELALYFAITGDTGRGKEALDWARAHPCDQRQVALIRDWVGDLPDTQPSGDHRTAAPCDSSTEASPKTARDELFTAVLSGSASLPKPLEVSVFEDLLLADPSQLYAFCEYLIALRTVERADLREQAPQFFFNLPAEFLLSRTPESVERPDWITHAAALALVALDPNLQSSQFLQSWALEQRQTIHEGPGVAYELLWADPYLPGVGYQNLDPSVYDEAGRLFARNDWSAGACWIAISRTGTKAEHCPPDWKQKPVRFGRLTLIPLSAGCVQIPPMQGNEKVVLWQLQPRQSISLHAEHGRTVQADEAGMLPLGANVAGKACVAKAGNR